VFSGRTLGVVFAGEDVWAPVFFPACSPQEEQTSAVAQKTIASSMALNTALPLRRGNLNDKPFEPS
jgi:hypothetical protein